MILELTGKRIDLARCHLLHDAGTPVGSFRRAWRITGGTWKVEADWIVGKNPEDAPAMIISRADFPGDVMLDFRARTVRPCTHDIDFMWNGSWDEQTNQRGTAYVGGVAGWWAQRVGFEKSPDYKLRAFSPLFQFEAGRTYHVQGGRLAGHCFMLIDGQLILEISDPDPIDSQRHTKVGFEAFCSHIQIREVKVRQLNREPVDHRYTPEFI
jgi:hypothetical protein